LLRDKSFTGIAATIQTLQSHLAESQEAYIQENAQLRKNSKEEIQFREDIITNLQKQYIEQNIEYSNSRKI